MHRFILQAYHPEYGCPAFETMFVVERLEELQALLGPDARSDPEIWMLYWLEPADLAAIYQRFGVAFDGGGRDVALRRWHSTREPPYLVHTGYELPLLLDGRKKLARFHDEYPPIEHGWEDQFDRSVAEGLLHKGSRCRAVRQAASFSERARHRRPAHGLVHAAGRRVAHPGVPPDHEDQDWLERHARAARGHALWLRGLAERLVGRLSAPQAQPVRHVTRLCRPYTPELEAVEHAGFHALPALDRPLPVIISFEDDLTDEERHQLGPALIRFRVKAGLFLKLVENPRERIHTVRPEQMKDVNALLLEKIEVVAVSRPTS
jgi:hypothetical protein